MAVGRPLVTIVLAVGRPLVIILMAVGRPLVIILMAAGRQLVIIVLAVGRLLMGFDDYLASGWSTVFFCRRIFHNFYVCVIACVLMPAEHAAAQSQARHNPGPILPDATNGPNTGGLLQRRATDPETLSRCTCISHRPFRFKSPDAP